jgi:hypothetical protein
MPRGAATEDTSNVDDGKWIDTGREGGIDHGTEDVAVVAIWFICGGSCEPSDADDSIPLSLSKGNNHTT